MLDARSSFQCARFMRNSSSSSSVALSSPPSSACLLLLLISFLKIFCHLSPALAGRVWKPCWICAKGLAGLVKGFLGFPKSVHSSMAWCKAAVYFMTFFCPQHISWLLKELISLHIFFSISDSEPELSSRMMRLVLTLGCLLALSCGESDMEKKIWRDINSFNNQLICWGQKNVMKYTAALHQAMEECTDFGKPRNPFTKPANPFAQIQQGFQTLPANAGDRWQKIFKKLINRSKRQAEEGGLLNATEEDEEEFRMNLAHWKLDLASSIGNMTCVLSKLNMLDENLQVNMDLYTTDMWEETDLSETLAGEDPEWRNSMVSGYRDCYDITQNWPQENLDRNPFTKVFGRHYVFFQCAKSVEEKGCAAAEMYRWLEAAYGKDDGSFDWTKFNMPKNKYERAALVTLVMYEQATPQENMIGDFFYGKSDFL